VALDRTLRGWRKPLISTKTAEHRARPQSEPGLALDRALRGWRKPLISTMTAGRRARIAQLDAEHDAYMAERNAPRHAHNCHMRLGCSARCTCGAPDPLRLTTVALHWEEDDRDSLVVNKINRQACRMAPFSLGRIGPRRA
jgi:hypothetical protein